VRVLVDLSAGPRAVDLLEEALELAVRLEAELSGLFVEDTALLRSSALPFVRQVHLSSGAAGALDPTRIERDLRLAAERARATLARGAEARRLRWSFRTGRGELLRELAREAGAADLVVLRRDWRASAAARLLSAAGRAELGLDTGGVLLARGPRRRGSAIVVALAGGEPSRPALLAAARLAGSDRPLVVLGERTLARALDELGAPSGLRATFHSLPADDAGALERALLEARAGLLVLSALDPRLEDPELDRRLEALRLPLLVWRGEVGRRAQ
jgi:hypothetical protein